MVKYSDGGFKMKTKKLFKGVSYASETIYNSDEELLTVNFVSPLGRHSAADSTIIYLLSESCTEFNTNEKLKKAVFDSCRGEITSAVKKVGDEVVLSLKLRCKVKNEEELLCGARILFDCVFRPNLTLDGFLIDDIEKAKERIERDEEEYMSAERNVAYEELIKHMCDGETFALSKYGTKAERDVLDGKELMNRWLRLMRNCPVQINYIGRFDGNKVEEVFSDKFRALERKEVWPIRTEFIPTAYEKNEYTEKILERKEFVCVGYRAGMSYDRDSFEATFLFSFMLNKMLFDVYGESRYSGAILDADKGIMTVICEVVDGDFDEVLGTVRKAVDKIRKNLFLPSALTRAQHDASKFISHTAFDADLCDRYMMMFTVSSAFDEPDSLMNKLGTVTREELVVSACMTDEDTVLILKKK